jgi:hypothetical protein
MVGDMGWQSYLRLRGNKERSNANKLNLVLANMPRVGEKPVEYALGGVIGLSM